MPGAGNEGNLGRITFSSAVHTKYKQFFDVDVHEYLDILKGVGAQVVIWTFYNLVVKSGKGGAEQQFLLLIIAALPSEAQLPNE
jgi:hypothetical protein